MLQKMVITALFIMSKTFKKSISWGKVSFVIVDYDTTIKITKNG